MSSFKKHIDELRTLLICTNYNFDVICISETRLHNEVPFSNVSMSGMYIKNGIGHSIVDKSTLINLRKIDVNLFFSN